MQDKVIDEIRKALHEKLKNCRPELRKEWESFLIWHRKIVEEIFDDVWKDFKNCRFMKTPQKSKN